VLDPVEIIPETPRPTTRAEYERMVEIGLFENERVELLYGVVVRLSPHGPEHDGVLDRLTELLVQALAGRARTRIQSSFAASDGSEPEPDVAVVPRAEYDDAHPNVAWLIVEIAKSSLAKDRGPKARLYAESTVEEYWVVNLVAQTLEVFTEPTNGLYARTQVYRRGDKVRLKHFSDVEIDVTAILRP
jgi:Uma2 family endonuclease